MVDAPKKKKENKCYMCGAKGEHLHVHHIIPITKGGQSSLENLMLLCPNCHALAHIKIKGIDFENFLTQLLVKSENYRYLQKGQRSNESNVLIDIHAEELGIDTKRELYFEVRPETSFTDIRFEALYDRFKQIKLIISPATLVFTFPGELTEKQGKKLDKLGVEIWDKQFLNTQFSTEIDQIAPQNVPIVLQIKIGKTLPIERQYIERLKKISPGRENAHIYQRLVNEILEVLFVPPFNSPLYESSDRSKTNRRDHVMPNYIENGFWAYLRDRYSADFIVIDSKNYSGNVTKACVLQMTNYLKKQGTGLFGLLIARNDGNRGCKETIREKWVLENKMVVILTDEDIENMLLVKSNTGNPEEILRQKIEDFRLSL